jgi:hypothetical protein
MDVEGSSYGRIGSNYPGIFLDGLKKNMKKLRIEGVLDGVRTGHHQEKVIRTTNAINFLGQRTVKLHCHRLNNQKFRVHFYMLNICRCKQSSAEV